MSIKERLTADSKAALKSGDRRRLGVLRMVLAQLKNVEIDKRKELSDEETIDVLVSAVKARRESLTYAQEGHREDLVQKEEAELHILEEYLPQQLSEAELQDMIEAAIREVGAETPRDMGRVMGRLMPHVKGRADGKLVNQMVQKALLGQSG